MSIRTETVPPRLLRALLLRGATLWLLARIMGAAALSAVATTKGAMAVLPMWTIAMTAALVLVDFRRRHELMLFRNLGLSTTRAVATATLPAVASEILLVMLTA